ncbi:hypothetical protein PYCCODRAFT_365186 [Trametes coccinea BRFM310]|uniref:Uncharacterized protein n=1 Tax=Trametes coccinea (strain BRFM310) TaxID=1353009 RepID=A0A1Y2J3C0_TRAC3|nr:hypothetical protein PYCCODRAFT_365186 [Trametes coccinea BRFM310]
METTLFRPAPQHEAHGQETSKMSKQWTMVSTVSSEASIIFPRPISTSVSQPPNALRASTPRYPLPALSHPPVWFDSPLSPSSLPSSTSPPSLSRPLVLVLPHCARTLLSFCPFAAFPMSPLTASLVCIASIYNHICHNPIAPACSPIATSSPPYTP